MHECPDNAPRHGRADLPGNAPASTAEIGARRSGPILMLGVTNRGTGRLPALGDRTVLPFSDTAPGKRAAPPRAPSRTPSRKGQEEPEEGQEEPEKEAQADEAKEETKA